MSGWIEAVLFFLNDNEGFVSAISAVASIILTIVIFQMQRKLQNRTDQLQQDQAEATQRLQIEQNNLLVQQRALVEDMRTTTENRERRSAHDYAVKEARRFIQKHHADRFLAPLAVIAQYYDPHRLYSRPLYQEFLLLSADAQIEVLHILDFKPVPKIDVPDGKTYWDVLLVALVEVYTKKFPGDEDLYYGDGKYVEQSLTVFGSKGLPSFSQLLPAWVAALRPEQAAFFGDFHPSRANGRLEFENVIQDVMVAALECRIDLPAKHLRGNLLPVDIYADSVILHYAITYFTACFALLVNSDFEVNAELSDNYGFPGSYGGETIDTMEDLFLLTMFHIHTRIILPTIEKETE